MVTARRGLFYCVLVLAGCTRTTDADPPRAAPTQPATPVHMTHTDPHDPAAWLEAQKIAEKQGAGAVTKHSDLLPFLFQGDRARAVLIHNGGVITARGPAVAGAYLRDLGVTRGDGPQIEDVIWTLWALAALPKVDALPEESYIRRPNDKRLADLTARIEQDGQSAHVVLHYFKPDKPLPKGAHVGDGGSKGDGVNGTMTGGSNALIRQVVRMTLDIPAQGTSAWRREDINWADPGFN